MLTAACRAVISLSFFCSDVRSVSVIHLCKTKSLPAQYLERCTPGFNQLGLAPLWMSVFLHLCSSSLLITPFHSVLAWSIPLESTKVYGTHFRREGHRRYLSTRQGTHAYMLTFNQLHHVGTILEFRGQGVSHRCWTERPDRGGRYVR